MSKTGVKDFTKPGRKRWCCGDDDVMILLIVVIVSGLTLSKQVPIKPVDAQKACSQTGNYEQWFSSRWTIIANIYFAYLFKFWPNWCFTSWPYLLWICINVPHDDFFLLTLKTTKWYLIHRPSASPMRLLSISLIWNTLGTFPKKFSTFSKIRTPHPLPPPPLPPKSVLIHIYR